MQLSFIVDQHVLIINSSLFHLLLVLGDLFVFLCLLEAFFLDSLSSFSVKFDSFSFVSVMSKLSLEILLLNHEPVVLLLSELKTVMREHMLKEFKSLGARVQTNSAAVELVLFSEKVRLLLAGVLVMLAPVGFMHLSEALHALNGISTYHVGWLYLDN